jgi:hypothetical protein
VIYPLAVDSFMAGHSADINYFYNWNSKQAPLGVLGPPDRGRWLDDRCAQPPLCYFRLLFVTNRRHCSNSRLVALGQVCLIISTTLDRRYSDGLRAGWQGFDSRQGQKIFLYSTASRLALWPTQPTIQWVRGGSFPGGKVAGA